MTNQSNQTSAQFLKRYTLPEDSHPFVCRMNDLSIISLHFTTYEELLEHPDCKYTLEVDAEVYALVERIRSLNIVANMLWPNPIPNPLTEFPLSRYEWLGIASDVFLMRYISVTDCALLLANAVCECGLSPQKCSLNNLRKSDLPLHIEQILITMIENQEELRRMRNARVHHGLEPELTSDDVALRFADRLERAGQTITGLGIDGEPVDAQNTFEEGLVSLQNTFNRHTQQLVENLNELYDALYVEFEATFSPLYKAGKFSVK